MHVRWRLVTLDSLLVDLAFAAGTTDERIGSHDSLEHTWTGEVRDGL